MSKRQSILGVIPKSFSILEQFLVVHGLFLLLCGLPLMKILAFLEFSLNYFSCDSVILVYVMGIDRQHVFKPRIWDLSSENLFWSKVRTQDPENFEEEVKSLVTACWIESLLLLNTFLNQRYPIFLSNLFPFVIVFFGRLHFLYLFISRLILQ